MSTYVYHATLEIKWEAPRDLGLFHKKSDAKQACQDDAEGARLVWDNSDPRRAFAPNTGPLFRDGIFTVTRRPVR